MRNIFLKSLVGIACVAGMTSCGDKFLETKYYGGVESEGALTTPSVIGYALNGTYYQLQTYYFAGNYAYSLGDIASDIVYWTARNNHQNDLYQFRYTESSKTLYYVWDYGYKVVDNAARIIEACENLKPEADGDDLEDIMLYEAEARCLRAYANLYLANVFCHQVMVNGTSYGNEMGLVLVDTPIAAFQEVSRASLSDTYNFIISDVNEAISIFNDLGFDRGDVSVFGLASAYGLLARTEMYMENWTAAAAAAENAISVSGIDELTYTTAGYNDLYAGQYTNNESLFALAIDGTTNWSANSLGTLYTTYGYSISPYLVSLLGEDDCRRDLYTAFEVDEELELEPGETIEDYWYNDNYVGAKFYYGGGNAAYANNFLINAPEMFLIEAEAYANLNQPTQAADALLVVAKRNNAITSTADLPATADGILSFLKEERARELFQEGFRFFDLRRWGQPVNLYANNAPAVSWTISNVNVSNVVFPIPVDEINTGYGVVQNPDWEANQPK